MIAILTKFRDWLNAPVLDTLYRYRESEMSALADKLKASEAKVRTLAQGAAALKAENAAKDLTIATLKAEAFDADDKAALGSFLAAVDEVIPDPVMATTQTAPSEVPVVEAPPAA